MEVKNYSKFVLVKLLNYENYQRREVNREGKGVGRGKAEGRQREPLKQCNNETIKQKVASAKEAFGEFGTVFLSKEEYQKLLGKFGPHGTEDWIDQLDRWQKKEAKQNASAYATILSWENKRRKDEEKANAENDKGWVKS